MRLPRMRGFESALLVLLALFALPAPASAYIDPISGSIMIQVIAASILAGTFTLKRFWAHVRERARRVWSRVRG